MESACRRRRGRAAPVVRPPSVGKGRDAGGSESRATRSVGPIATDLPVPVPVMGMAPVLPPMKQPVMGPVRPCASRGPLQTPAERTPGTPRVQTPEITRLSHQLRGFLKVGKWVRHVNPALIVRRALPIVLRMDFRGDIVRPSIASVGAPRGRSVILSMRVAR